VLPFDNPQRRLSQRYFRGVQDKILTDLAKIADLKVISRTPIMQYKTGGERNLREIGQQLQDYRVAWLQGCIEPPRVVMCGEVNAGILFPD
jgi:TolB-like protein